MRDGRPLLTSTINRHDRESIIAMIEGQSRLVDHRLTADHSQALMAVNHVWSLTIS